MAITSYTKRGFALLIAVIFTAVMLALGTALASIGYKQQQLAGTAIQSQYAFYAADAALECTLYADQQQDYFDYIRYGGSSAAVSVACDTSVPANYTTFTTSSYTTGAGANWVTSGRVSLDNNTRCADVTVYKYLSPDANGKTTYIYSQGYNVPCATVGTSGASFVARGLYAQY